MWDWLSNLEPEFLIIFGSFLIVFIIIIINMITNNRTLKLIGKRALGIIENIIIDKSELVTLTLTNSSFVSFEASAVGYLYHKKVYLIRDESIMIMARDSFKISFPLSQLRERLLGQKMHIKKLKVYVEDALGRRTIKNAKHSHSAIKKQLKVERIAYRSAKKKAKKERRLALKMERFETGNYRFYERLFIIIKLIFKPVRTLAHLYKKWLNRKLKDREVANEIQRKTVEQQERIKDVELQSKREQERKTALDHLKETLDKELVTASNKKNTLKQEREVLEKEVHALEQELAKYNIQNEALETENNSLKEHKKVASETLEKEKNIEEATNEESSNSLNNDEDTGEDKKKA